jgi:pyruvate dehydrogenase E1 component alpha subunit
MAEFTSREEHSNVELVSDVVAPYGFSRATVDGGDVGAVWDQFGSFLTRARAGEGPFLLECMTYRRRGHYEGDHTSKRDELVEAEWVRRDPLARFGAEASKRRWVSKAAAEEIEADALAAVDTAVEFARRSDFPTPELAESLVYA